MFSDLQNPPNLWAWWRRRRRDQNNRLRDCVVEVVVEGPPLVRAGQGGSRERESTNINLYPDDCWSCRALDHLDLIAQ